MSAPNTATAVEDLSGDDDAGSPSPVRSSTGTRARGASIASSIRPGSVGCDAAKSTAWAPTPNPDTAGTPAATSRSTTARSNGVAARCSWVATG